MNIKKYCVAYRMIIKKKIKTIISKEIFRDFKMLRKNINKVMDIMININTIVYIANQNTTLVYHNVNIAINEQLLNNKDTVNFKSKFKNF